MYKIIKIMEKNNKKINSIWISGFVDAEDSFSISFYERKQLKTGWGVTPSFQIELHNRDLNLLIRIKSFFGDVGTIHTKKNRNMVIYQVRKLNEITKTIIPHFE